jgi:hypothetical protein
MVHSLDAITVRDGLPGSEPGFRQECSNLIRILSFTVDSLCDDNFEDERKLRNIRTLIATLSSMKTLAEDLEFRCSGKKTPGCLDDINGVRYFAVNTYELERFSAK